MRKGSKYSLIFFLDNSKNMEDLDLALSLARERLPFSQEHPEETIIITLKIAEFYKDPLHIFGIGVSGLDKEVYFRFHKDYIRGILVGWSFSYFYRQ